MGGRGGAGGTRSTYRGDSTARFRQLGLDANGNPLDGSSGKSGGANQRNKSGTTNAKSGTGGVQNGGSAGGQNRGDSGVATSTVSERDVVVERPKIPADADLNALFEESDIFEEFMDKYAGESDVQFRRQYPIYFSRWRATVDVEEAGPEGDEWLDALPKTVRPPDEDPLALIFDDAEKVNRQFSVSKAHTVNCTRCAHAFEMNARGYDVKAVGVDEGYLPRTWLPNENQFDPNTGATWGHMSRMWRDENGRAPAWHTTWSLDGDRQAVVDNLEAEILSWGEGSRGFVGVTWDNGKSHIFNVVVHDGRIVYVDAQPTTSGGQDGVPTVKFDSDEWKSRIDPREEQRVLRVDNLTPTEKVGTWVAPRSSGESNLIDKADFFDEFNRRWLNDKDFWGIELDDDFISDYEDDPDLMFEDLYSAFYYGWEAVWRGDVNPQPPRAIARDPVFVEFFERGVELAEVPT